MNIFLKNKLKRYIAKTAVVSNKVVIEGAVWIEEGVKIEDYAVIKGPSYIGKNSIIGNQTLVRQSMIEKDCIVGFGSEVVRSYIGPGCFLHHNFIGDSILEGDINPSWGTTFANLRLDKKPIQLKLASGVIDSGRTKLGAIVGKGAFFGVNCALMPGVTIAAGAKIFPQSIVSKPVVNK